MKRLKFGRDRGNEFYTALHERVNAALQDSGYSRYANRMMHLKVAFYLILFAGLYSAIFLAPAGLGYFYALYLAMGVSVLLIGFNISHDAAHGVIFRSRRWNDLLFSFSFNLQGNNAYIWKRYHIESHHVYTNVHGSDIDVLESPLLRMTEKQPRLPRHRFQHLYAPFLYLFYSINWFFFRDMLLIFRQSSRTIDLGTLPQREVGILIFAKLAYLGYMIALPILLLPYAWYHVIAAFVLNHFLISIIFTAVLGCSHLSDQVDHPEADENGRVDASWAMLQMRTSLDYNVDSPLANFLLGGFNAHTLHHLFPNICHIHYLKMARILRQTAQEYDIPYNEAPFHKAIASHFRFLKQMGHAG